MPPTSGPLPPAIEVSALQKPIACARSRGSGYARAMSASDEGMNRAAPSPCSIRAPMSNPTVGATPQSSEATVNRTRPLEKTRRAPSRSPRPPARSSALAKASVYPSMTQDSPAIPVPRSFWMLGTATFPAVTSSSAIPSPKLVATSVQRGETPVVAASRETT